MEGRVVKIIGSPQYSSPDVALIGSIGVIQKTILRYRNTSAEYTLFKIKFEEREYVEYNLDDLYAIYNIELQ
jgi:hypothetical protein